MVSLLRTMKHFTTILLLVGLFSLASAKFKYYVIDSNNEQDTTFTYNSWEPKAITMTYLSDAYQMIQAGPRSVLLATEHRKDDFDQTLTLILNSTLFFEGPATVYEGILYYVDEINMIIYRYNTKTNSIMYPLSLSGVGSINGFHIDAFNQSIFVLATSTDQTDFAIITIPLDRTRQSNVLQISAAPYNETAAGGVATGKDGHYYYATFSEWADVYDTMIYKVSLADPTQIESVPFCPGTNVYYSGFLWDEKNNQMLVFASNNTGEYVTKLSMNGGGCHLKAISTPRGLFWWSWTFDVQTRTVHAWTMDEKVNSYIIQYDIDTWKILSRSVRLPAQSPIAIAVAHE